MRKSDKKLENSLRLALTDVCEIALKEVTGFQWLTHSVSFSDYPNSLRVLCVFDSNVHLDAYLNSAHNQRLLLLVNSEFKKLGITFKNIKRHISYDSEENCNEQHDGNWAKRIG